MGKDRFSVICTIYFWCICLGWWVLLIILFLPIYGSLFHLNSNLLSITMFTLSINKDVVTLGNDVGDRICLSKGPVLLFGEQVRWPRSKGEIYNCFTKDDVLYVANDTVEQTTSNFPSTPCFVQEFWILTERNSFKKAMNSEYRAICSLKENSGTKRDPRRLNETDNISADNSTPYCRKVEGPCKFNVNQPIAKRIEQNGLANCITKVSIAFAIFLFSWWCLRFFLYPFLIGTCCIKTWKNKRHLIFAAFYCIVEFGVVVITAILPTLYGSTQLEKTSVYSFLLIVNAVHVGLSLIPLLCVLFRGKYFDLIQCPKINVKVKKKVLIWKQTPLTPAVSRNEVFEEIELIERPIENLTVKEEIKNLVLSLWNPNRVGIGRDARGLQHNNIEIIEVRGMGTPMSEDYAARKLDLMNYASCMDSGRISVLQDCSETLPPIATMENLTSDTSVLKGNINEQLNEVYLFHGTKARNISSIEERGFDVKMNKACFVGRGLYFAESPVKADQYSDKTEEYNTMILARVLLGKTIVLKDNTFMNETAKPPCSSCLGVNCDREHKPRRRPYDSVVLARPGGFFREFVVFENCLAHPEYLITYKRV